MEIGGEEIGIADGTLCPWDPGGEWAVSEALQGSDWTGEAGADLGTLTDVAGCGGCGGCGSPGQTISSPLFGESFYGSDAPGDFEVDSGGDVGGGDSGGGSGIMGMIGAWAGAVSDGGGGGGGDGGDLDGCGSCGSCGGCGG